MAAPIQDRFWRCSLNDCSNALRRSEVDAYRAAVIRHGHNRERSVLRIPDVPPRGTCRCGLSPNRGSWLTAPLDRRPTQLAMENSPNWSRDAISLTARAKGGPVPGCRQTSLVTPSPLCGHLGARQGFRVQQASEYTRDTPNRPRGAHFRFNRIASQPISLETGVGFSRLEG